MDNEEIENKKQILEILNKINRELDITKIKMNVEGMYWEIGLKLYRYFYILHF